MNYNRVLLFFVLFASIFHHSLAQLKLPSLIGDNMVLQRNSTVPLWGWSTPGTIITIQTDWDNSNYSGKTAENGRWIVNVETPDAGGPFALSISSNKTIHLKNILIGEVWLCSGQSNMEMPVEGWTNQPITGSEKYIEEGNYPDIRLFTVERKVAYEPAEDCIGNWTPASSETVAKFSATGYFFGLELYKKLKIPIGLIHSSWGGTPAEAWTSQEYIDKIPYFHTSDGKCDAKEFTQRKINAHEKIIQDWLENLGFVSPENTPDWVQPHFDDSNWRTMKVPASWDDNELGHFEGAVELRFEITDIPGSWTKKKTMLDLGPIDEMDIVWVNGVQVGRHLNVYDWPTFRSYEVKAGILQKGRNVIAVKVANTSGLGGINGEAGKLKLYPVGKRKVWAPLAGNWKFRSAESFSEIDPMPWCNNCAEPQTPTTLYNGMIAPLIPFKIKGAVWYQGESNRYDGELYNTIFPNMIENWRANWNQGDFPFYFVQIAPYSYADDFSTGMLREAQFNTLRIPNTGMVVTMDVGSLTTIHPPDKKTVGDRLALWALHNDYGFSDISYSGPLYKSHSIEDQKIRIEFDYGTGLRSDGLPLKHFTIAGSDGEYYPATAEIENNTVVVYSKEVSGPVAVRFGWGHTDITNLFNQAGLPASPFQTDNHKR